MLRISNACTRPPQLSHKISIPTKSEEKQSQKYLIKVNKTKRAREKKGKKRLLFRLQNNRIHCLEWCVARMWNALFDFGFGRQFLILHGVQLLNTTQLSVCFIHGSDVFVFPSSNVNWMEVLMLVYTLNFTFYLCSLTHHFQPNRQTLWCHTFNRAFWYIWNWKSLKREQFSRNKSENLRRLLLFHAFRSNSFCRINNHAFNLKVHCRLDFKQFLTWIRLAVMWKQTFHINHGASFETLMQKPKLQKEFRNQKSCREDLYLSTSINSK